MNTHICPASHAGFLSTSLRRLIHKPEKILRGLVKPGETVVDIGCGPGFFTLPLAQLVGNTGTVIAADLQAAMLARLKSRADKTNFNNTIKYHQCEATRIGITQAVDFILAFYMVHEVPDAGELFRETREMVKKGGRMLYVEPKFHVSKNAFLFMTELAHSAGWETMSSPEIRLSRTALFR